MNWSQNKSPNNPGQILHPNSNNKTGDASPRDNQGCCRVSIRYYIHKFCFQQTVFVCPTGVRTRQGDGSWLPPHRTEHFLLGGKDETFLHETVGLKCPPPPFESSLVPLRIPFSFLPAAKRMSLLLYP